jgi:sugar fermentation stimulation protein A
VTSRGLKHLVEQQNEVNRGHRAVIFYLIQRMDADFFEPADCIDPAYGKELRTAVRNGVELFAYDVKLTLESISLDRRVPHRL